MDSILLIFKKSYEEDLLPFLNKNCLYKFEPFYDYETLPNGKYYEYMEEEDYEESNISFEILKSLGHLSLWQLNILKEQPFEHLLIFLKNLFTEFKGYAMDYMSDHL